MLKKSVIFVCLFCITVGMYAKDDYKYFKAKQEQQRLQNLYNASKIQPYATRNDRLANQNTLSYRNSKMTQMVQDDFLTPRQAQILERFEDVAVLLARSRTPITCANLVAAQNNVVGPVLGIAGSECIEMANTLNRAYNVGTLSATVRRDQNNTDRTSALIETRKRVKVDYLQDESKLMPLSKNQIKQKSDMLRRVQILSSGQALMNLCTKINADRFTAVSNKNLADAIVQRAKSLLPSSTGQNLINLNTAISSCGSYVGVAGLNRGLVTENIKEYNAGNANDARIAELNTLLIDLKADIASKQNELDNSNAHPCHLTPNIMSCRTWKTSNTLLQTELQTLIDAQNSHITECNSIGATGSINGCVKN